MEQTLSEFRFRPLLSTKQAAHRLGLSPRTLESLRVKGGGPRYIQLGRAVRYEPDDLEHWIECNRKTSTSQYHGR
ncbi:MAG: helix-turn-helix domain-containing protein [Henriciella sp.]|nr:helix-turn-helix domain-containing protein [Henriciella sp.]